MSDDVTQPQSAPRQSIYQAIPETTQTTFAAAFDYMMDHEDERRAGKVTVDTGGVTRWGISQHAFPHVDVRNLALESAGDLYRENYWKPVRGYDFEHQGVANKLFDMAVNMGPGRAVRYLQRALAITDDGHIGPVTIATANGFCASLFPETLLARLCQRAREHYLECLAADPERQEPNRAGWLKRAACSYFALCDHHRHRLLAGARSSA